MLTGDEAELGSVSRSSEDSMQVNPQRVASTRVGNRGEKASWSVTLQSEVRKTVYKGMENGNILLVLRR